MSADIHQTVRDLALSAPGATRVLEACAAAGTVKRVVMTSSVAAVAFGHSDGNHAVRTEADWSQVENCEAYQKSKTLAERAAWDFVRGLPSDRRFELAVINPGFVLGPLQNADPGTSGELIRKLMVREMIEPTRALDVMVEESVRPLQGELEAIVRDFLGARAGEENVRLSTLSIASQCVFYYHCRAIVHRLFPEQEYGSRDIERLVRHITRFSLAALKSAPKARKGKSRTTPARRRNRAAAR